MGALPENPRLQEFRDAHYRAYPHLHQVRLHWLWTCLHLGVAIYGVVLTAIILTR